MPDRGKLVTLNGQFDWTDWNETFEMASPNQYSLTQTKGDVTLVGNIAWDKVEACVQWLLGYAYVGPEPEYKLKRVLPQRHPKFQWMWCNGVTNIVGKGKPKERVKFTADRRQPDGMKAGNYDRALVYATFGPTTCKMLPDDSLVGNPPAPAKEFQRFCVRKGSPFVENLIIPNGQLLYNAPYSPQPGGVDGRPLISPSVKVRQEKTGFELHWLNVPLEFICDNDDFPVKLQGIQKCVNKDKFFGRAPGTLLCEDVTYEVGTFPIATTVTGTNQLCAEVVRFKFVWFDPPHHIDEAKRGWNLWPTNLPSGIYVPAKQGGVGGAGVDAFKSYTFADAFTHWSLPLT